MTTGGEAVGGEIFVNIRTEGGGGIPGAGGTPRPAGGGAAPTKDPAMSMLNDDQKKQLENARQEKKALKEYQDFQKLKGKENQNELLNELQRARKQATMVAGAVTTGMLARNSKIMSTTMGSLSSMFSAFIDIFLMPFIPLIIPVLKYIADLIPRWQKWTQDFADMFKESPLNALKWAGEQLLENSKKWGISLGAMFGISEEQMESFYAKIGEGWETAKGWWKTSVDYVKKTWEASGGDVGEFIKIVLKDAWCKVIEMAVAGWEKFKEWQPEVAANISSTWTAVASYIRELWEAGGCSVIGFFAEAAGRVGDVLIQGLSWLWKELKPRFFEVAKDIGSAIMSGLSWLWSAEGGGMKDRFISMWKWITDNVLASIGNYLEKKAGTRFGLPHAGFQQQGETVYGRGGLSYTPPMNIGGPALETMGNRSLWRVSQGLNFSNEARARANMRWNYERNVFSDANLDRIAGEMTDAFPESANAPQEIANMMQEQMMKKYGADLRELELRRAQDKWTFEFILRDKFAGASNLDGSFP